MIRSSMTSINPSPAALFDLDGTLVDTYDAHFQAWRETCAPHGVDVNLERFTRSFGRTNPPIIRDLWKDCGLAEPEESLMTEIADEKERRFRELLDNAFLPMPGAVQLIRNLHDAQWSIGIGTSAPQANLDQGVQGLGIDDIVGATSCGDEVRHGKPDPEVFLLCAQRLGASPEQCVVIEDAPAGVDAAKNAGMASIGLASKGRTRAELSHADLVIDSLEELDPDTFTRILQRSSS